MRVMVFVMTTVERAAEARPDAEALAAMGRFNDALAEAGVLVTAAGLAPAAEARRVAFDGPARTVRDGPFPEAGDVVVGFWIWEVADMAAALAWAKRCPNPMPWPCEIELRAF